MLELVVFDITNRNVAASAAGATLFSSSNCACRASTGSYSLQAQLTVQPAMCSGSAAVLQLGLKAALLT